MPPEGIFKIFKENINNLYVIVDIIELVLDKIYLMAIILLEIKMLLLIF